MPFPFERYETLAEPRTVYFPAGYATLARQIYQWIERGGQLLAQLLDAPMPELEILLVAPDDWQSAPQDEPDEAVEGDGDDEDSGNAIDEQGGLLPYWTSATEPPLLVVPTQLDPIIGSETPEKLSFLLFHELSHAFLEADPRPWPLESPLWADEWQMQFAALWLTQQLSGRQGVAMTDLHDASAEIFEPEPDGKTPVTVRGFDWYDDTSPEDYLDYTLLLERFAADLLANYDATILPDFLERYRHETPLLSDDVTGMLAATLGEGGADWLENLVYF
jgi:hypothetical protein